MSSKHKALFALTVYMIGMLSASDAEAGLFFRRRPVFFRVRERIAERREQRSERREQRRGPAAIAQKGEGKATGKGKAEGGAANGNGQAQIANQQIKPVAPLDVCNVRLVRCTEQENADTKEKTPFCQVRSTPAGSPEEVLRVTKAGTLVVMRDDGLASTTPEMIRFLGAQYQAIAAQQAQTGGALNPLMVAFNTKNAALLNSPQQACIGGINNPNLLAYNQNPGFGGGAGFAPNYTPPVNPGGVPLAPADGAAQPLIQTPPQSNPGAQRQQQDQGGGPDIFGDPAGLGTVQYRPSMSRAVASTEVDAHSGSEQATVAVRGKKRPRIEEALAQTKPAKPDLGAVPSLGSPFQVRTAIQ